MRDGMEILGYLYRETLVPSVSSFLFLAFRDFWNLLPHVGQVCGLFSELFVIPQVLCCVYGMGILAGAVFALDSFLFLFYFIF